MIQLLRQQLANGFDAPCRWRYTYWQFLLAPPTCRRQAWCQVTLNCDRRNEAVAAPGNVDDVATSRVLIAECSTQSGNVNGKVGRSDERFGPYSCHQLLITEQSACSFDQREEDFESTATKMNRLVVFGKQSLCREETEWTKCD